MARGKNKSTLIMEAAIHDIVGACAPITVRGVAYKLFVAGLIADMGRNETQRVSRVMTAMREREVLDWTLIVDDSRFVRRVLQWSNPDERIKHMVRGYRRDYWQDQDELVEIWAEKATVRGVLQPVLDKYGVPFREMKGFGSYTAVRQAAEDMQWGDKLIHVLYIGDWDPSGMFMSEVDLPGRLARYGAQHDWDFKFQRIAVTEKDHYLPDFPVKGSDTRAKWFKENHGHRCWELDALDPNALRKRVKKQIKSRLNLRKWKQARKIEKAEVESIQDFHKMWDALAPEEDAA
jgi:hypothetical protein